MKDIDGNNIIAHPTKADGDCAFHAALGVWNISTAQFEKNAVDNNRKIVAEAIRNSQSNPTLFPIVKEAMRELVMSGQGQVIGEHFKELSDAYKKYLEEDVLLQNPAMPWNALFNNPLVLNEYATFFSQPHQCLLPCELQIIAYVFNIGIDFYNLNVAPEPFNPDCPERVFVYFNGVNHYERMNHQLFMPNTTPIVARPTPSFFSRRPFYEPTKTDFGSWKNSELHKKITRCAAKYFTVYVMDDNTDIAHADHEFNEHHLIIVRKTQGEFILSGYNRIKPTNYSFPFLPEDKEILKKILPATMLVTTLHKLPNNHGLYKKIIAHMKEHCSQYFVDYLLIANAVDFLQALKFHLPASTGRTSNDNRFSKNHAELPHTLKTIEVFYNSLLAAEGKALERALNCILEDDENALCHAYAYHINLLRFSKYLCVIEKMNASETFTPKEISFKKLQRSKNFEFYVSVDAKNKPCLYYNKQLVDYIPADPLQKAQQLKQKMIEQYQSYAFLAIISMMECRLVQYVDVKKDELDRNVVSHFIKSLLHHSGFSDDSRECEALLLLFFINNNLHDPHLIQTLTETKLDEVLLEHQPPTAEPKRSAHAVHSHVNSGDLSERAQQANDASAHTEVADDLYLPIHHQPAVLPEKYNKKIERLSKNKTLVSEIRYKVKGEVGVHEHTRHNHSGTCSTVRAYVRGCKLLVRPMQKTPRDKTSQGFFHTQKKAKAESSTSHADNNYFPPQQHTQ